MASTLCLWLELMNDHDDDSNITEHYDSDYQY